VFFTIRSKNRRKLQKATYDTETRISKKLHDELANDVFNAMTYADTQDLNNPTNKEFLLENLDKIYTQSRNISKENSQIDTGDNFEAVLKAMLSSYNSNNINVIIKNNTSSTDWLKLKKESKIVIYRTLQELMVNMRKHSRCSLVVIGFETYKKGVEINYSDNGIGCSDLLNLKKGLQNAENRILSINGTITFETETNKGFKAKLKIPK
jgi:signal transduction histidine kinase